MTVTLNRGEHVYSSDGGVVYRAVTDVIEGAYNGPEAPEGPKRRAADRGSVIHALIRRDIEGRGESYGQFLGERAAARAWMRAREAAVVDVEALVHRDDWRVAGTLDLLAWVRPPAEWHPDWGLTASGRVLGIVDWKTGRLPPMVAAQLAAYRQLAKACRLGADRIEPTAPLVAVQLGPDGSYREHWFPGPGPDRLWHGALAIADERLDGFDKAFAKLR